jgi:hypothetical protein
MSPTTATVAATGRMILSVARENGTEGRATFGSIASPPLKVSAPAMSASVRAGSFRSFAASVVSRIVSKDEGRLLVTLGMTFMKRMESAVRPAIVAPAGEESERKPPPAGERKCVSCAFVITIASPFTKPSITGWGTSRIHLPILSNPAPTWMRPASRIVAGRYATPWRATSGAVTTATAPDAPVTVCERSKREGSEKAMASDAKERCEGKGGVSLGWGVVWVTVRVERTDAAPAAGERRGEAHRHRRPQAHDRRDAGDAREADRLGDHRQGHRQPGQRVAPHRGGGGGGRGRGGRRGVREQRRGIHDQVLGPRDTGQLGERLQGGGGVLGIGAERGQGLDDGSGRGEGKGKGRDEQEERDGAEVRGHRDCAGGGGLSRLGGVVVDGTDSGVC